MTARTAVVVLSAVLAFAAFGGALNLQLPQAYPEFIVGHITWRANPKLQDLIAPPVLLATLLLVYALGSALARLLPAAPLGGRDSGGLPVELIAWSLPAVATVAGILSASTGDIYWIVLSAAGSLAVLAISELALRRGRRADEPGLAAFGVLLITFIPAELAVLLGRVASSGGMIADLSRLGISGRDAGLLRFRFSCAGRRSEPRLRVLWRGDGAARDDEQNLVFSPEEGVVIVPLDAYPRWLLLRPRSLAIRLVDPGACDAIRVTEAALYQRKALSE